ncbi:MAG: transporter substrate-binding domain-containing protein [Candidatus Dormibacteraeota bacterium]|nr:transporter substrate-binding domain-containing protein [Candidatus Dormibacteraeota bacterium]
MSAHPPQSIRTRDPSGRAVIAAIMAVTSALLLAACGGAATSTSSPASTVRPPSDLGRQGTINVGLDMSDAAMIRLDPNTLQPFGIADDLERRLGQQSGLTTHTINYASTSLILAGLARQEWDVAFLPVAEAKAGGGQVTSPIVEVEQTYLVLGSSAIHSAADVDAPGHHVAVETNSPADLSLTGTLKGATLVKAGTDTDTLNLLKTGGADAMAGSRAALTILAGGLPGSRVLTGSFATVPYAIATPPSRPDALTYLNNFAAGAVDTVKASISRDALQGATAG